MSGANTSVFQRLTQAAQTGGAIATLGVGAAAMWSSMQQAGALANNYTSTLTFPSDLISTSERNYYMDLKFEKYEKRSIRQQSFQKFQGGIRLPLPNALQDNTSVAYSDPDMSPAVGALVEQFLNESSQPPTSGQGFVDRLNSVATSIGTGIGNIATGVGVTSAFTAAENLGTGGSAALSNLTGLAINPFQTVLFERPIFKTHQFSWRLIPRNEQESAVIRDIVKSFKYHMLPGITDESAILFTYPERVRVTLYPDDTFLYEFKPCVLESVSVNYAPGTTPAFYKRSNAPMAVDLSITLKEIEYWTKRDYSGRDNTQAYAAAYNQRPGY